jgi:hypothetical protein
MGRIAYKMRIFSNDAAGTSNLALNNCISYIAGLTTMHATVQLEEGMQAQNNKSASELKLNHQRTFSYETNGRGNAGCSTIPLES